MHMVIFELEVVANYQKIASTLIFWSTYHCNNPFMHGKQAQLRRQTERRNPHLLYPYLV